ncbi:MAG: glycosyltransferase family 39 protein [Pirellulaceae bacterium]
MARRGNQNRKNSTRRNPSKSDRERSNTHSTPDGIPAGRSVDRRALLAFGAIIAAGVLLRVLFPSHVSVEHFDEGVYASNIWFSGTAKASYPYQYLYAPPLLPHCITAAQIFDVALVQGGDTPSDFAANLPAQLAAIATLLGIAWIVRSWFGSTAAVCSCILLAGNDLHIVYSRTAMTDVPVVCWMMLAVGAIVKAYQKESYRWALVAAVFVALGWWTKYSGWLPLAIGISGLIATLVCHSVSRRGAVRSVCIWLVIAFVSFSLWYPHVYSLRDEGGYASVAANHRQYSVGLAGWWSSAQQQWTNVLHFDSWIGYLAVAIAASWAAARAARSGDDATSPDSDRKILLPGAVLNAATVGLAALASSVFLGTAATLLLLACCGIASHLLSVRTDRESVPIGRWCGLAAWAGLLLATPLYTPYPRLALPFIVWTIVWAAEGWSCLGRGLLRLQGTGQHRGQYGIVAAVSLVVVVLCLPRTFNTPPAWEDRSGMRDAAIAIDGRIHKLSAGAVEDAIIFVYGEPALLNQLNRLRLPSVVPMGDMRQLDGIGLQVNGPLFVLTGPHVHRDVAATKQLQSLELVEEFPYRPSGLVMLNHWPANTVREKQLNGHRDSIRLYRMPTTRR